MAIAMTTVTINAAFLQEIKEVHTELWEKLAQVRQAARGAFSTRVHRLEFAGMLNQLRDSLGLHFSLEEAYGYFEHPRYAAPRLSERADRLRGEHADLYLALSELVDLAEQFRGDPVAASFQERVVSAFALFDARLQSHEEQEQELIFQVYHDDIGVGD